MADHASPEEMKKHVRVYMYIGALLLLFTVLTVYVSYLELNTYAALYVGLTIAFIKGSLVCAYFMHLLDEKKIIYATLILTVVLFLPLMFFPWFTDWGRSGEVITSIPGHAAPAAADHSGHGDPGDHAGHGHH